MNIKLSSSYEDDHDFLSTPLISEVEEYCNLVLQSDCCREF